MQIAVKDKRVDTSSGAQALGLVYAFRNILNRLMDRNTTESNLQPSHIEALAIVASYDWMYPCGLKTLISGDWHARSVERLQLLSCLGYLSRPENAAEYSVTDTGDEYIKSVVSPFFTYLSDDVVSEWVTLSEKLLYGKARPSILSHRHKTCPEIKSIENRVDAAIRSIGLLAAFNNAARMACDPFDVKGFSLVDFKILSAIMGNPGATCIQIRNVTMSASYTRIHRTIDGLFEKGLVGRHQNNKKRIGLTVTEEGLALIGEVNEDFLKNMGPTEIARWVALSEKLVYGDMKPVFLARKHNEKVVWPHLTLGAKQSEYGLP